MANNQRFSLLGKREQAGPKDSEYDVECKCHLVLPSHSFLSIDSGRHSIQPTRPQRFRPVARPLRLEQPHTLDPFSICRAKKMLSQVLVRKPVDSRGLDDTSHGMGFKPPFDRATPGPASVIPVAVILLFQPVGAAHPTSESPCPRICGLGDG